METLVHAGLWRRNKNEIAHISSFSLCGEYSRTEIAMLTSFQHSQNHYLNFNFHFIEFTRFKNINI